MAARKTTKPKPEQRPLKVAYIGNFGAEHSTENHVARALEFNGHEVYRLQENKPNLWDGTATHLQFGTIDPMPDLFLWTRTGWDYTKHGYRSQDEALGFQWKFLQVARRAGVPVVGFHLDLFHGLNPEREAIVREPFFASDIVVTADGGSQEWFASNLVNHHWMPPGVSAPECEPGMFRDEFHSKLAFVGSWQGGYHPEADHRYALVRWLGDNFRRDCKFWPEQGRPAVRGADLRDLYASVDLAIGDSCLAGHGHVAYCSDRIPETLGRGAHLVHPHTELVTDGSPWALGPTWQAGEHLSCWKAGDWDALGATIEHQLANPGGRAVIAAEGRAHTLRHHTYERRMEQLIELLNEKGMLK